MASFEIAEAITGKNEGLYADNKADTGGETYAGIARNHWPKWRGWLFIDRIKDTFGRDAKTINKYAKIDPFFAPAISEFYKKNFWNVLRLDEFVDQQLANSVYDFGVNSGTTRSAKFLQQSIISTYSLPLVADGQIGSKTLSALNNPPVESKIVYNEFSRRREQFYRSIAVGNQAQFLKSWLSRLKPYK